MNDKIHDAFDTIHASDSLKEQTKQYVSGKIYQAEKPPLLRNAQKLIPVLCCLLIVFLSFGGYHVYNTPVATISLDVNPSVELEINTFDRIIGVTAYNDDGEIVTKDLNLSNKKYEDAVQMLLDSEQMAAYLGNDALVSIAVSSGETDKTSEIEATVSSQCSSSYGNQISCHSVSTEDVALAHEAGLSFGKYRAYEELHDLDEAITVEDVEGLTMREIQDMIDSHHSEGEGYHNNGTGSGNGNCKQNDTTTSTSDSSSQSDLTSADDSASNGNMYRHGNDGNGHSSSHHDE